MNLEEYFFLSHFEINIPLLISHDPSEKRTPVHSKSCNFDSGEIAIRWRLLKYEGVYLLLKVGHNSFIFKYITPFC